RALLIVVAPLTLNTIVSTPVPSAQSPPVMSVPRAFAFANRFAQTAQTVARCARVVGGVDNDGGRAGRPPLGLQYENCGRQRRDQSSQYARTRYPLRRGDSANEHRPHNLYGRCCLGPST